MTENRPEKVQAVWDILSAIQGRPLGDASARAVGATAAEISAGEQAFAAELDASRDHRDRRLRGIAYLAEHYPGQGTMQQIIDAMSDDEIDAFLEAINGPVTNS